jgi:hypothetical protein
MTVPSQVQRQADEAERRVQQLANPQATSPGETTPTEQDPPNAGDPPVAQQPQTPDEVTALRQQLEKSEQRYRSLQGMYDADRRRADEQMTALNQRLEAVLQRTPQPAAEAPPTPHTDKDLEDFGEETVAFVTRVSTSVAKQVAMQVVEQVLAQRLAPVTNTVQEVAERVQRTAQDEYFDALTQRVPDWKEINVAPQFLQWLAEVDPMTGMQRQAILSDAHQRIDAHRTAAVFLAFKAEAGMQTQAQTPPAGANQRRVVDEREAMVEPARTSVASRPSGRPQGRTYTRAQIAQFYRDVTSGRITGAEANAMEQDILKAQSEGRIVG